MEIDTDDTLELLNTVDSCVRVFAVKHLSRVMYVVLIISWLRLMGFQELLYLLQLVQTLKFESAASDQRSSCSATGVILYDDSSLTDILIT